MMKKIGNAALLLLVIAVISWAGCRRPTVEEKLGEQIELDLRYATHFSASVTDFGYVVTVYPEGKSDGVFLYALTRNDTCVVPPWWKRIHIPVQRIATNSGSNFEFLRLLGVMDSLVAACDSKFIYSDTIKERIESGKIKPLGSSYEINVEQLMVANPDILLLSDLRDDPHADVCPVVHNFEWKESTALGRAEWVKFIGLLFDQYEKADSIFSEIETRYNALKSLTDTISHRPTVFAAGAYGDTWYMTAGQGYMAAMYEDAGGDYLLKSMDMPTFTCGTEWLLANYSGANYWMNCHAVRLAEIDERLRNMQSVETGRVYHFNKRMVEGEGYNISDFYECAVAHPDVVLADLISVFHPYLLPNYETVYLGRCESLK